MKPEQKLNSEPKLLSDSLIIVTTDSDFIPQAADREYGYVQDSDGNVSVSTISQPRAITDISECSTGVVVPTEYVTTSTDGTVLSIRDYDMWQGDLRCGFIEFQHTYPNDCEITASIIKVPGFCQGLSIKWLLAMRGSLIQHDPDNNLSQFYKMYAKFCTFSQKQEISESELGDRGELNIFLRDVFHFQTPSIENVSTKYINIRKIDEPNQYLPNQLFKRGISLVGSYDFVAFQNAVVDVLGQDNNPISFMRISSHDHAIAAVKYCGHYILYDPNYKYGCRVMASPYLFAKEVFTDLSSIELFNEERVLISLDLYVDKSCANSPTLFPNKIEIYKNHANNNPHDSLTSCEYPCHRGQYPIIEAIWMEADELITAFLGPLPSKSPNTAAIAFFPGVRGLLSSTCYIANQENAQKTMERLLDKGVNVDDTNNLEGGTALQVACQIGNLPLVKYLVSRKAQLDLRDDRGFSALDLACQSNVAVVQYLVDKCSLPISSPDPKTGWLPIMYACIAGKYDVYNFLKDKDPNFNVNVQDKNGFDLLILTAYANFFTAEHVQIVRALINANANVNHKDKVNEDSALVAVCDWSPQQRKNFSSFQFEILTALIDSKADPNITDNRKQTPLMFLCNHMHLNDDLLKATRYLLKNKANVNAISTDGCNALMLACKRGHGILVNILVREGADIHAKCTKMYTTDQGNGEYRGVTALEIAEMEHRKEVVNYFKTADPKWQNYWKIQKLVQKFLEHCYWNDRSPLSHSNRGKLFVLMSGKTLEQCKLAARTLLDNQSKCPASSAFFAQSFEQQRDTYMLLFCRLLVACDFESKTNLAKATTKFSNLLAELDQNSNSFTSSYFRL